MQEAEIIERLVATEEGRKSNTKRIDTIEKKVENIYELTASVKAIAIELKAMREDFNDVNDRLKIIEEKPVKQYEETKSQIKKQVVSFFIGIVLAIIAFKLGLNKFM